MYIIADGVYSAVGTDSWTNIKDEALLNVVPFGTLGVLPDIPSFSLTQKYMDIWAGADKIEYPDVGM